MPNYNQDLQSNNAELDAILQTINNLPEAGQTKPEVAGAGKIIKNGKQTFTPPPGSVFSDFTADVEVPDIPPVVQALKVTKNGQYLPPEGVDGFNSVDVSCPEPLPMQEKSAKAVKNGPVVVTADPGKALSKATVEVAVPSDQKPETAPTEVIKANGEKTFNPPAGSVFSSFTADVQVPVPEVPETQEKELTITENGDYPITPDLGKVLSKVLAHVNVSSGGGGGLGPNIHTAFYIPATEGTATIPFPDGTTADNIQSVSIMQSDRYFTSSGDYGWQAVDWVKVDKEVRSTGIYSKDGWAFSAGKKEKPITIDASGITVHGGSTAGATLAPTKYIVVIVVK